MLIIKHLCNDGKSHLLRGLPFDPLIRVVKLRFFLSQEEDKKNPLRETIVKSQFEFEMCRG